MSNSGTEIRTKVCLSVSPDECKNKRLCGRINSYLYDNKNVCLYAGVSKRLFDLWNIRTFVISCACSLVGASICPCKQKNIRVYVRQYK
jgi:hypothetical protein